MPENIVIPDDDVELLRLDQGGGLQARTMQDRERHTNAFKAFINRETEGLTVTQLVSDEEGRKRLDFLVGKYFHTMTVVVGVDEDGEALKRKPKLSYASKIRGCIKNTLISEIKMDLTDRALFPESSRRWKSFQDDLADKGLAETVHYGEVDPITMEMIFELLADVEDVIIKRGEADFDSYLAKIPLSHRDKVNYLLQWGAVFCELLFEACRGGENMDKMKKSDFAIVEDTVKNFKFVKHIRSEKDKNHAEGTVSALNGCIPFITFGRFNPGRFFELYLNSLPEEATKEGAKGGFLFMKPKANSKKFDMHDAREKILFEANQKGKFIEILIMFM